MAMPALAQDLPRVVSPQADDAALTIYPDGLALITETRTFDLPKGKSTLVFEGVSDRMVPASVLLREFSGFTLERNFDYARLSKANLFQKSIGETVTITRTHKASGKVSRSQATIIAAPEAPGRERYDYAAGMSRYFPSGRINGVVFAVDGKIEVYQCSGLSEGTKFDNLPDGLNNVPELSIDVETKKAGPQTVVISYLADNFSWKSDYRLDLANDGKSAKLAGWITLTNNTAQSFKDAPLAIVAGQLNRSYQTRAPEAQNKQIYANCWPRQSTQTPIRVPRSLYIDRDQSKMPQFAPSPVGYIAEDEVVVTGSRLEKQSLNARAPREVKEEDLGDYKLYRVSDPVTVAAYQTKQIRFINTARAKVDKFYTLDVNLYGHRGARQQGLQETSIEYRLNNDKDGEISKALPEGTMLVFAKNEDGRRIVTGEADVRNTAVGNPMKIYLDNSFLVQVNTVHVSKEIGETKDGDTKIQLDMRHTITNATDKPAIVEINIPGAYTSLKINRVSHKRDVNVGPNGWTVFVRPNATATLKYRASYID